MTDSAWVQIKVRPRKWPLLFYYWIYFSKRKMEKTRKIISGDSMLISRSEVARQFSEHKISKGDEIVLRGKTYVFVAATHPEKVFPECFLFYNPRQDTLHSFANSINGQPI